jgi:hypothetical protein
MALAICSIDAAVFVFFPQVGLQKALHHWEAVADRLAVPQSDRRSMSSYPFPHGASQPTGAGTPLVQSTNSGEEA